MNPRPRYARPTIWSLDPEQVRELLGPVESQYMNSTSGTSCLPIDATSNSTLQDQCEFPVPAAGTQVTITVDVTGDNASCAALGCGTAPDPNMGPLDPKLALYPPGVAPSFPPVWNGYDNATDCDPVRDGCGAPPVPSSPNACVSCDTTTCTFGPAGSTCASLSATLNQAGNWTLAIAPQAPSFVAQGQGCYTVTITAAGGQTIGQMVLTADDQGVTFLPPPN